MLRKSFIATCLMGLSLSLCSMSMAETCPSVNDIKHDALHGWKTYDSDDGTPLSLAREIKFKKMIERFALAEWVNAKNNKGTIHCYYTDNTGSSLEAYFAKESFAPKQTSSHFWYQVSGFMHCAAGMENCQFEQRSFGGHQLAKK